MVYMKKVETLLVPMIKGFVLCAMVLQIVSGMVYIGRNFMYVPQYWETTIYGEMAEQFVLDEYMAFLYPMLVKLCSMLPVLPYQIPIYLIQLLTGLFSVWYFVSGWTERKVVALFCSLWVNTLPFVAQAHVTVLPHSLVFSFLLLMVLVVMKATLKKTSFGWNDWVLLLGCYTISSQLSREYLWAGTLLLVWAICVQFYAQKHRVLTLLGAFLLCTGFFAGNTAIYKVTQTPGYYGRMQRSAESVFFQRVGMSIMSDRFKIYMPQEVDECFTGEDLEAFAMYPYQLQREFGPMLEARFGKERANEIYWEMGLLGLKNATRDTVYRIAEDTFHYVLPMVAYGTWEKGNVLGATSWNYQQFTKQAPELAVFYMRSSYILWNIGFVASVVLGIVQAFLSKKCYVRVWLPVMLYVVAYGVFFAMSGTGMYDYKRSLLPLALGCGPVCYGCIRYLFKERT